MKYEIVVGTEKERIAALRNNADIYIINRDNVKWLVEKMGSKFNFDMVVIDELSSFKNYNSQRFRSFMKVRPRVKRMVGLTGTPSSNGLMDLFAEFKVLDMGKRLGRFIGEYRNNYFEPDKRNGQIIFSYKPLPNAEEQIYKQISDITISMKSTDYLEMPELIKSNYSVTLDDKEWNKYQELKEDLVLELPGGEITASNAAVLSNKLIQMANGAIYDENGEFVDVHSKKLEALEDLIESANGKPVLVAYWFKHDLERIEKHLNSKKIEFQRLDSDKSIEDWNNGKISVALIHPASTGHGLNLQDGGSTIIWFGLTWSLELYQQTNARLWRQGQKSKTVVIEHIISKGTIDEQIIQALEGKYKVQDYSESMPEGNPELIISALSIHHLENTSKKKLFNRVYESLENDRLFVNYDQFCSDSSVINENVEEYWIDEIKKSGISEIEYERWLERKKLDREISISKEIQMLKDVGFRNVECIYSKEKFGVIVSIK